MQPPEPPRRGDGGSAPDGRGPRGELDPKSFFRFVATRVRETYERGIGLLLPVPLPSPRQDGLPDFLSPCARSVVHGHSVTSYEAHQLKHDIECAIDEAIKCLPYAKEEERLADLGKEQRVLLQLISSCADDTIFALEVGVRCNKISAEDAADLKLLIARMSETMKEKIARRWSAIPFISTIWGHFGYPSHFGSIPLRIKNCINFYRSIKNLLESLNQGPGLFKHLGKDAKCILYNEYMGSNLRIAPQPDTDQIVAGFGRHHQNTFRNLLMNFKLADTTVDIIGNRHSIGPNAVLISSLLDKIKQDGIFGAQTKGVIYLPLTYGNAKFEFQSLHPFAGITASVGLQANPALNFSILMGTKVLNFGGMYEIDTLTSQSSYCSGLSARIGSHSLGLTMNHLGGLTAMYTRSFDKDMHISAMASHCSSTRRANVVVGGMKLFEGDLTAKARISSSGFASAMVKKMFWGHCSVGLTSEVDLRQIRRVPAFGIVFSLGRSNT